MQSRKFKMNGFHLIWLFAIYVLNFTTLCQGYKLLRNWGTQMIKERPSVKVCREYEELFDKMDPEEDTDSAYTAVIAYKRVKDNVDSGYQCGGVLITSTFILSIGQCASDNEHEAKYVLLVASKNARPIKKIYKHPDYHKSYAYNDIVVVELQWYVFFKSNLLPICLHTEFGDLPENSTIFGSGVGFSWENQEVLVDEVLESDAKILSPIECNETLGLNGFDLKIPHGLDDTQFCATDFDEEAYSLCTTLSGSPLVYSFTDYATKKNRYRLIGIKSAGIVCPEKDLDVYTKIITYLDFIENIVWPP